MKIKRIFSAGFILMVLLSSTGYGSQNDFTVNPLRGQVPTGTVLIEHSENSLPEFRQTIKVSLSAITKTRSFSELHDAIQRAFLRPQKGV